MTKILLFLLPLIATAQSDTWNTVQALSPGDKIEVRTEATKSRGTLVSAAPELIVLRDKQGDRSFPRVDVREVKVASGRARRGFLWTAIGAAAGVALAFAVCPGCSNEGADAATPGFAAGAGIGAAFGFSSRPYKTVYKTPKR